MSVINVIGMVNLNKSLIISSFKVCIAGGLLFKYFQMVRSKRFEMIRIKTKAARRTSLDESILKIEVEERVNLKSRSEVGYKNKRDYTEDICI